MKIFPNRIFNLTKFVIIGIDIVSKPAIISEAGMTFSYFIFAAITDIPQTEWIIKKQKCIFSLSGSLEIKDQGADRFACLVKAAVCFQDGILLLHPLKEGMLCFHIAEGRSTRLPNVP